MPSEDPNGVLGGLRLFEALEVFKLLSLRAGRLDFPKKIETISNHFKKNGPLVLCQPAKLSIHGAINAVSPAGKFPAF